jgi:hypothetical protein
MGLEEEEEGKGKGGERRCSIMDEASVVCCAAAGLLNCVE